MPQIKTSFTATGTSEEFVVSGRTTVRFYADFTTGTGVGTVQLQALIAGDWLPADAAVTATMDTVEVADGPSGEPMRYRWNCSAYTSGTIHCYLG